MVNNQDKPTLTLQEKTYDLSIADAERGTEIEHNLTAREAFKRYPAAVGWTLVIVAACVMEGYDTAFMGNLFAQPSFQRHFGSLVAGDSAAGYQIAAKWQTALSLSGSVGIIIGTYVNGFLVERIGMRRIILLAYVAITGLTFILVFGQSLAVILAGQILCGISWGIFGTSAPAYASEVCPLVLRGYLTMFIDSTFIIGELVAAGVLRGVENMEGRWAYDIVFAVQWAWPIPLFILTWFCPDSPWWLIRKGRLDDAKHSLRRLFGSDGLNERFAMMVRTDQHELEGEESSVSFLECFKGVDLRRTEIAFFSMTTQALGGLPLQGYNTYFFELAGLSASRAFDLTIAFFCIGLCGNVTSWFLVTWYGRRTVYVICLFMMTTILFIIGFVALSPESNNAAKWVQAVLLIVWAFLYDTSVGPLGFCILGECSAIRLRSKTVAIGRSSGYFWMIILSVVTPYMLNPANGNWKGKTAFFYGGTCLCCFTWAFFRLPEFKGRTFEELDILFERRIPARKFKETKVDAYSSDELREVA